MAIEQLLPHLAMHVDEISLRVGRKIHWIHACSAGVFTLLFAQAKRYLEAMAAINSTPRCGAVIIHDCWTYYCSCEHCIRQLSGALLLRGLTFILEGDGDVRTTRMKRLLQHTCAQVAKRRHNRFGRSKVKHVTTDLDPTDDRTHGGQQLTFVSGSHYSWFFLPLVGLLTFNREVDQYLFCHVLRAGNAQAKQGVIRILNKVIERLRAAFPKARILVRLDGRFCGPALLNCPEDQPKVDYIIGMAENKLLMRSAPRRMATERRHSKRCGKSANVFGETRSATQD